MPHPLRAGESLPRTNKAWGGKYRAVVRKWLTRLPDPFTAADHAAGFNHKRPTLQAKFSRTRLFDRPLSRRYLFKEITACLALCTIAPNLSPAHLLSRWARAVGYFSLRTSAAKACRSAAPSCQPWPTGRKMQLAGRLPPGWALSMRNRWARGAAA